MANPEGSPLREAEDNRLPKGVMGFESIEQAVMSAAFVIVLAAISWGVLSRYVVPTPATWVEEVTFISFGWLIFVGAAEVHRRAQHVSVDLLTTMLPASAQRALALGIDLLVICYCFYVAYLGVRQTIVMHSSLTSMLRIPMSIAYFGFTFGIFMMGIRGVQRLLLKLRGG